MLNETRDAMKMMMTMIDERDKMFCVHNTPVLVLFLVCGTPIAEE